jgi:hypothetical protein
VKIILYTMNADNKKREPWLVREDGRGWIERPTRVVGSPRAFSPEEALSWNAEMLRLSPLCGKWFPSGVFKFRTWEDEQEWTRNQISQAQKRLPSALPGGSDQEQANLS